MKKLLVSMTVIFIATNLSAQNAATKADGYTQQFSILFGLNQPLLLHGFNVEANYWTRKWVFDYSHGFGLQVSAKALDESYEVQHVKFRIPHSLGLGVGYRFTKAFNLRFEPKLHWYEAYYEDDAYQKKNSIVLFKTYTLGLGAYYRWLPFEKNAGAWKGITIVPSIRYWQKVGSTLSKEGYTYYNAVTQKPATLKAPNIGLANTPVLVNISIGYTF